MKTEEKLFVAIDFWANAYRVLTESQAIELVTKSMQDATVHDRVWYPYCGYGMQDCAVARITHTVKTRAISTAKENKLNYLDNIRQGKKREYKLVPIKTNSEIEFETLGYLVLDTYRLRSCVNELERAIVWGEYIAQESNKFNNYIDPDNIFIATVTHCTRIVSHNVELCSIDRVTKKINVIFSVKETP